MRNRLHRCADRAGLLLAAACLWPSVVIAQADPAGGVQGTPLRTFELAKPPEPSVPAGGHHLFNGVPRRLPDARGVLRTSVGLGYVQGADWGSELVAGGSFAGAQVQASSLMTSGSRGFLVERGNLTVFEPEKKWRAEAGDIFSSLRGAAVGGRFSWSAAGGRRPSLAVYTPYSDNDTRGSVLAYRDQLVVRGQTLLDAEFATDRSYLLRNRLSLPLVDVETNYRVQQRPVRVEDGSISGSVGLGRGFVLSATAFRTFDGPEPSEWNSVSMRVPLGRHFDVTVERAFAASGPFSQSTVAAMASVTAGNLRAFHRHQFGAYDLLSSGTTTTVERQQTQSMSSYRLGRRVSLTLQLATQRAENGQVRHWEELHSQFRVTRSTTLRTVTAIPDPGRAERFQAYLRQDLPSGFAVQADYGRLSTYQPVVQALDRSRLKVMVFKTLDIATPARGADVRGSVRDNTGRGVAGARVKLGPYSTDTDASGGYVFRHVPRGEYDLSLDPDLLPADFAWDGRGASIATRPGGHITADLSVTPLNALHGRVYVDRNGNGRYDQGEGIPGAVLQLGARLTAADQNGAYAFFNVWPETYTIRLHALPPDYSAGETTERRVTLGDGGPVTGADFIAVPRVKPILWDGGSR